MNYYNEIDAYCAEWLLCRPLRDDKPPVWRPVEPGALPLAARLPGAVEQIRAYGNSINPWCAAEFIKAALT